MSVAMEARSEEKFREVIQQVMSTNDDSIIQCELSYSLRALESCTSRTFRNVALKIMVEEGYDKCSAETLDRTQLFAALQLLDDPSAVGKALAELLGSSDDHLLLLGYQLCFDLVSDSGNPGFVEEVASALKEASGSSDNEEGDVKVELKPRFEKANKVLTGGFLGELNLQFLYKNSDSDPLIMKRLKKALEEKGGSRISALHNAAVVTHSFLNAGTTNDTFLRDDLAWFKKASNWARFSATASLGVIHANHTSEAMTLLQPYLPPSNNSSGGNTSDYAQGGALYALGLIHASTSIGAEARHSASQYLRGQLQEANTSSNEVLSHGAALGIGLAEFGSKNMSVCEELKDLLMNDSAVAGEAAGIGIGLVLCGANFNDDDPNSIIMSELLETIQNYAKETQHEKIIRGISIGIALIHYQKEESADAIIQEMKSSRDPILRYGAMYTLALAYVGTGSNSAVKQLLHCAVSDVNNDVRMASVIGLAFVLYKTPERVPELVKLLLESFNSHVRYAACLAVGIAMAGTGDELSLKLLEPMLDDMTDFVRQGAFLGSAFILMQCNGKTSAQFREKINSILTDKHVSMLTKMGAVLATGILDAGGRNVCLKLGQTSSSRGGGINFTSMPSVAGTVLFLQHWHWYPMMHMLSMAFQASPTYIFGLNKDFDFPKHFEVQCNAKPSMFAYPKRLEDKKEEAKKRVETVTLSTTAKNKAREMRKKKGDEIEGESDTNVVKKGDGDSSKMSVDEIPTEQKKMDLDTNETAAPVEEKKRKRREQEPSTHVLTNPSRVTSSQIDFCAFDSKQRYAPINKQRPSGVIMLRDLTPGEEEDVGKVKSPSAENEADPPESFEWAPPGHDDYIAPIDIDNPSEDSSSMDPKTDSDGDAKMESTENNNDTD